MEILKPKICEGALLTWYHGCSGMKKNRELSLKARKQLSALGWDIWYVSDSDSDERNQRVIRYISPQGKVFYSLKAACRECINGGREEEEEVAMMMTQEPMKPNQSRKRTKLGPKSLNRRENLKKFLENQNQTKPRVLQSSNRVRALIPNNSSDRKPRTVLSWLIDNNVVSVHEKVYYRNKAGKPLLRGNITRDGIQCSCCSKDFSLTAFEAHAGSTNHRPAANIILDNGRGMSLSDCQMQVRDNSVTTESPETTVKKGKGKGKDRGKGNGNSCDLFCSICRIGGYLICCDQCPSVFHLKCLGLNDVPFGQWFCPFCCCGVCGVGFSSVDDSFQSSVDDSFHVCKQCERRLHRGCLKESEGNLFCTHSCERVFSGLQKLTGKPIPVENNLRWTLLKCDDDDLSAEDQSKLSVALEVMHECFLPSKDVYTGRDVVEDVIFNRRSKLNRLNFRGFYTVILENNDDIVCVATVRVYGNKVAEMPLVATRFKYRRRGMCRVLVNEIENNLAKLGVEKLVLPAVPAVVNTWINKFGFTRMSDGERLELVQYIFLDFDGTIMCQKDIGLKE